MSDEKLPKITAEVLAEKLESFKKLSGRDADHVLMVFVATHEDGKASSGATILPDDHGECGVMMAELGMRAAVARLTHLPIENVVVLGAGTLVSALEDPPAQNEGPKPSKLH